MRINTYGEKPFYFWYPHISLGIPKFVWGSNSGIPKPKQGSPNNHTKMGIPKIKWGCKSSESPNRFGDHQTEMGIPQIKKQKRGSPNQFGDANGVNPQTDLGIPKLKWGSPNPKTKT